ncbi:MAG: hypothetical protein L6Q99_06675 [Planctomycetes bacterium]|nr:hypothetical protein [Planctomycetota bacterium]
MTFRAVALSVVFALASCRSYEITPAALRTETDTRPERAEALSRWTVAIELANQFLASEFRQTLPDGRLVLADDGMRFVERDRELPMRVVRSTWGDWVVRVGFAAQEREWGFVVGQRSPVHDGLVDHSFFRGADGELTDPFAIASLVLHEATHVCYREGTVGFWNGVAYYFEAIFLFRYDTHSDERHANATSEEFRFFLVERGVDDEHKPMHRRTFEQHLAEGPTSRCTHGSGARELDH